MSQKGFTIVEIAIVITIITIMASLGLTVSISRLNYAKFNQTEAKMEAIDKAIAGFVVTNGRLPCPANASLPVTDANFGIEYCTGNHSAAVTLPTGVENESGDNTVIGGAVPVITLNLPNDFTYDGWENRFTYVITRGMAGTSAAYGTPTTTERYRGMTDGLITIQDATTATITDRAAYALISHGPNGWGAWVKNGGSQHPAPTSASEAENSHLGGTWNAIFIQQDLNSTFDDIVTYKRKFQMPYIHKAMTNEYACDTANTVMQTTADTLCTLAAGGTPGTDCTQRLSIFAKELNDLCAGSR